MVWPILKAEAMKSVTKLHNIWGPMSRMAHMVWHKPTFSVAKAMGDFSIMGDLSMKGDKL